MENDFDPDWPHGHVALGGMPAKIIYTDAKGDYPIIALVLREDGVEDPYAFTRSGRIHLFPNTPKDHLRNAPAPKKRITGWLNIYYIPISNCEMASVAIHPSKEEADSFSRTNRLACIYIDVEEGEGL